MRRGSYLVLMSLLALLIASGAQAQLTTGSISGLVTDVAGETALPGAQVEAVFTPTGTRYSSVTQSDGRFRISGARAGGPYTITVSMDGFEPGLVDNVQVSLGEDTHLTIGLQLAGVTDVVTVVGTAGELINPARTGAKSNVATEQIETLPTIGRKLEDFARTNPFFAIGSENEDPDAISVAGRSSRYNNIQIDGSVNNDLFGLADTGTPGGQAGTTPISLDAIQEVQLVLADMDVRQGGFSGGSVNAITRSGANDFAGSAFYFTRDDGDFGDGPAELGTFGEFSEDQYGFRLGGPIKRDKAFFFVNADIEERTSPTGWSIDGSSGQAFGFIPEANRFRDILISRYGYDPGPLTEASLENPSDKYFARVDFNLSDSHNLTLRHNYVDAADIVNRPGSFAFEWESEGYDFLTETNSTVAQLNSTVSNTKFNELRVALQTIEDRRSGVTAPFPHIEIESLAGENNEFEAGTEAFSTRNALDQDVFELTNDFTWLKGDHTITIGTHNEFFGFENLFIQNAFGSYEFSDLDAFEEGVANDWDYTVVVPGQPAAQSFDVNQIGLYVGDQWQAKDNLTLTYGLRVDVPFFPDSPSRNPTTEELYGYRTDEIPDGNELWQPRLGFNWDPERNGKSQLRGGAGIFAGRTPYVWISNQYGRTGVEQIFFNASGSAPFIADPFGQEANIGVARTSVGEFNLIEPSFEFPQLWRVNLAYDRELPWWGLIASAEVIFSDSIKEVDFADVNLTQTGGTTFDGRPEYTRVTTDVIAAYLIRNTSGGDATNAALRIEKPPGRGSWWGSASYAYGESNVVNDGSSSRAVSNWRFHPAFDPNNATVTTSNFELEHRWNATIAYDFNRDTRYPTTVSAFYNAQSGRPFSYLMGSDFVNFGFGRSYNGDGQDSNDLFYVPTGPDDVVITNGTYEQLNAFIESDPCLRGSRGTSAPRNCARAPWSHTFDVHIAQTIPVKGNVNVQLTADILNVANLFDDDSGVLRYINFNTFEVVEVEGFTDDGIVMYSLDSDVRNWPDDSIYEIHNINSRYRLKLGVRLNF